MGGYTNSIGSGSYDLLLIKLGEDLSYCGDLTASPQSISTIDVTNYADLSFHTGLFSDQLASSITSTPFSPFVVDITH